MEHFAKTETPECNATTRTNQAVISAANTNKMEHFFHKQKEDLLFFLSKLLQMFNKLQ